MEYTEEINQDTISYPNTHDPHPVKKVKSMALKQHKAFNGMTKSFQILWQAFRHDVWKIGIAFEAVAVICQYKIEAEEPLYDILIEDVFKEEEDSDSKIESYYSDGNSNKENIEEEEDNDDNDNYAMMEYADIAEETGEQEVSDFLWSPTLKSIRFSVGKGSGKKIHCIINEELSHSCSKLRHKSEGKDKARVLIVSNILSQQDDNDDDDDNNNDY